MRMQMKMAWLGISLSLWKAFIVKREIRIFYKRNVQRNKMEVIMLLTSQMDFVVVVQPLSCVRLCNPMDCSTPDFPVLHHLPELAETHVPWVDDAIRPSCPLSSPSPAINLSQHHGPFQWVRSLQQVTKELELQYQSYQWILRIDFL